MVIRFYSLNNFLLSLDLIILLFICLIFYGPYINLSLHFSSRKIHLLWLCLSISDNLSNSALFLENCDLWCPLSLCSNMYWLCSRIDNWCSRIPLHHCLRDYLTSLLCWSSGFLNLTYSSFLVYSLILVEHILQ